ncbi:MAG TPA: methylamine dehydrogenase accessory protein MauD, partial [Terriglobales bacterium]|nr:methylamine dehydrogenase accessory protein MauD [Terriglobales bacterium]
CELHNLARRRRNSATRLAPMNDALVISHVLLWLVVIALAILVLALLRQIGLLHERIAPAGALMPAAGPRVGDPAPVVEVEDWQGARLHVGAPDEGGRDTLLLFVSPSCPICKSVLAIVESLLRHEGERLQLVLASDGPRHEHQSFVQSQALLRRHPYVLSAALGLAYQVGKLPYAILIDAEGKLRARGLVNTREHLESLFEAQRHGVANLQEYLSPLLFKEGARGR